MSEETEALAALEAAGVTDLYQWAAQTAFARVSQDYEEAAGHDQAVVGTLAYKYFQDLFDRATSSGKFALPDGASAQDGRDVLQQGISGDAFLHMPHFVPDAINRSNCNGSPGWALGDFRWLLQSYRFGQVDSIVWGQKSQTKLLVARQPFISGEVPLFSFSEFGLPEPTLIAIDDFVGTTLVLAHAFNRENGAYEAYVGHSHEPEHWGDGSWYWRQLVASGGAGSPGASQIADRPLFPGTAPSHDVEDADVRLRRVEDDAADAGEGS